MRETGRYRGFIFDLDGTIYLGDALLPGALDTISLLRKRGHRAVFVTNKPLEPRSSYAFKLSRLGIATLEEDVINSTRALVHYLQAGSGDQRLYVLGEERLWDELSRDGFALTCDVADIDIVVASFDRTLDYAKLNIAHQALMRGARFMATNGDATCPVPGGAIPDCAGVIAFLEASTGRKLELVAGKPSEHILGAALDRLSVPAEECLMVGDRLATDILMGVQAGMDTALVLTGVTTREMLQESSVRPTYVFEGVSGVRDLV